MKIEFRTTKAVRDFVFDSEPSSMGLMSFILPFIIGFLVAKDGVDVVSTAFVLWIAQMISTLFISEVTYSNYLSFWFCWIPNILLAPLTLPYDIFSSMFRRI